MNACRRCSSPGFRQWYKNYWLCQKHYRFQQMRMTASKRGLYSPTNAELEAALSANLQCPCCGVTMAWSRDKGSGSTVSLQHDDDGGIRIICLSCNQHHKAAGDMLYELDDAEKPCTKCGQVKPLNKFHVTIEKGRWKGVRASCKDCTRETNRNCMRKIRAHA